MAMIWGKRPKLERAGAVTRLGTLCALFLFAPMLGILQSCSNSATCQLTVGQAPEIRGLRLGSSVDEVRQRFNTDLEILSSGPFGKSVVEIGPDQIESFHDPKDLRSISLEFLDGFVTSIRFKYNGGPRWNSAGDFAQTLREKLGLKGELQHCENTVDFPLRYDCRSIRCNGFSLSAGLVHSEIDNKLLYSFAEMNSSTAQETEKERRRRFKDQIEANDETSKQSFRP